MTNLRQRLRAGIGAGALIAALATMPVRAQTPPATPASQDVGQSSGIDDIIVTAERRETSIQRTPIAISAIAGDALARSSIINIEGFANNIPNVTFGQNTSSAKVFIRGVGLDAITPGSDPRVAIYADGVYQPRSQAAFIGLFDLERIEVLAGPQGTLYGRNATAGAINFISRGPGSELNGYATLTGGNYGLFRGEGAVGGPLGSNAGFRLAVQHSQHNGFGKSIVTGEDIDDEDSTAVRGKLVVNPSSNIDITFAGDYYHSDDNSNGLHLTDLTPGNVPTPTKFSPAVGGPYVYPSNPRDLAGFTPHRRIETYGFSVTANFDLASFMKLTSVTGWRKFKQAGLYDPDATSFQGVPASTLEDSKAWSQEFRAAGKVGIVDYLVGGYYFHEKNFAGIDPTIRGSLLDVIFGGNGNGAAYTGALTFMLGGPPPPFQPLAYYRGPNYGGDQTTKAWAIFTQETIHVTDELGIDLGLRYSHETKNISEFNEFDPINTGPPIPDPLFATIPPFTARLNQSATNTSTDPKVTVHYQFTPQTYGYLTYSQGFKSGGFNAGFLQAPFAPERLKNYEAGLKSDFLDHRLRVNLAGFYYDYSNLQVNITEGIQLVTRNAAKAKLYGFEGQITALPIDALRLGLNLSYLHSEYTKYISPDPLHPGQGDPGVTLPNGQPAFDLSGNQLAYAPKGKINGEVAYTFHASFADITPRADVTWTAKTYFSQFNAPWAQQRAYTKLDLFLDVENKKHGLSFTAFVKNATDKYYKTSGTVDSDFLGYEVVGALGDPLTFGVAVTKRF